VLNKPVREKMLVNKGICADIKAGKELAEKAQDVWKRVKPVTGEDLAAISFTPGSEEIIPLYESTLEELGDLLLAKPEYYIEIRGVIKGNKMEDEELAQKRAEAVAKVLREQKGIVASRMKTVKVPPGAGAAGGTVVFALFEDPEK
jgi:outer membrane protein OmpA-like peptidoglycan-associated protein